MGRDIRARAAPSGAPVRRGPTLTCVLFDPARGTTALRAATVDAAGRSGLPTSVEAGGEAGGEEGLVQLHVWVGGLGLGVPEDRPEAWAELGRALGDAVAAVDPAFALSAPEWGADSLLRPDYGALAPGLRSGRVRRRGLDSARAERFAAMADRDVVRADDEGWAWAATDAISLWDAPRVAPDRLVPAVFHAWWGRRPDESAPPGPRLRVAAPGPDPHLAAALAAALPVGWSSEPTAPDSAVAAPPSWADAAALRDVLRDVLGEVAGLLEPRWALLRDPDVLWLPAAPAPTGGLQVRDAPGAGVLVEGPYSRLERLLEIGAPGEAAGPRIAG